MLRRRSATGVIALLLLGQMLLLQERASGQQDTAAPDALPASDAASPTTYAETVGDSNRIELVPDTQDASIDPYLRQLLVQLEKSWTAFIPDNTRDGHPARVTVLLEILPDGRISKGYPRIGSSSNSSKLDQAAIYAIRYWQRYDALPKGFQDPSLRVHVNFGYNVASATDAPHEPTARQSSAGTAGVPVTAYGNGVLILSDTQGVDFQPYVKRILSFLKMKWFSVMPEEAKMGRKGATFVTFRISPSGDVSPEPELEKSSGDKVLDKAAIDAVSNSAPFEPLPTAFHGPYLKLRIVFLYNIRPEDAGLPATAK